MIALVVMIVAVLGTMGALSSSSMLGASSRESSVAINAARGTLEHLFEEPFWEVFALYNEDPTDDPGGVGTAPGPHFTVAGLDPQRDDADGFVGRILLPASGPGGSELRENLVDPGWGMPRDLSGDGAVDGADHSGSYKLLPVRVRLEWTGASGNRVINLETLLSLRRG